MKPLTLGAGQLWVHMFPWKKWVLMIYETNHKWTAEMKWKWRNDRRSERYLRNCVKKLEKKKKFRTSTGCEPMTSRLRMRCSTNWAMKPLTLGAGQLHKLRSRVLSPEPLRFVWICLAFLLLRILYITRATKGYHFDLTVRFRHWSGLCYDSPSLWWVSWQSCCLAPSNK